MAKSDDTAPTRAPSTIIPIVTNGIYVVKKLIVGCNTTPAVNVSAFSGRRLGLEPRVTSTTVCAPSLKGFVRMPDDLMTGPNSSATLGARMSRDRVTRKRHPVDCLFP